MHVVRGGQQTSTGTAQRARCPQGQGKGHGDNREGADSTGQRFLLHGEIRKRRTLRILSNTRSGGRHGLYPSLRGANAYLYESGQLETLCTATTNQQVLSRSWEGSRALL